MSAQHELLGALKDLESDLKHSGRSTCAIVYLEAANASDEHRRVLQALSESGNVINYSQNICDQRFLEGSGYQIETIGMTREMMINTLAGKLVLPRDTKFNITSRR